MGKRGENRWERITWDEAYGEIAEKLGDIRENLGSEYFAMLQGIHIQCSRSGTLVKPLVWHQVASHGASKGIALCLGI